MLKGDSNNFKIDEIKDSVKYAKFYSNFIFELKCQVDNFILGLIPMTSDSKSDKIDIICKILDFNKSNTITKKQFCCILIPYLRPSADYIVNFASDYPYKDRKYFLDLLCKLKSGISVTSNKLSEKIMPRIDIININELKERLKYDSLNLLFDSTMLRTEILSHYHTDSDSLLNDPCSLHRKDSSINHPLDLKYSHSASEF